MTYIEYTALIHQHTKEGWTFNINVVGKLVAFHQELGSHIFDSEDEEAFKKWLKL